MELDYIVLSEFTLRCVSVLVMVLQINHVWLLNSWLNISDVFHRDVVIIFIVFIFTTLKQTDITQKQLIHLKNPTQAASFNETLRTTFSVDVATSFDFSSKF